MNYSIKGLNHMTFSVSDLERSILFYKEIFNGKLLYQSNRVAYFLICDEIWLALNVEEQIPRNEIHQSYTYMAFSISEDQLKIAYERLSEHNCLLEGRIRREGDGSSLYFQDSDGHKFEFHTGTLENRLQLLGQFSQRI